MANDLENMNQEEARRREPGHGALGVSGGRKWVMGSSKATNVACLAVFGPDTTSALSRKLEIQLFVSKCGFASEWLKYWGVVHLVDLIIGRCAVTPAVQYAHSQ